MFFQQLRRRRKQRDKFREKAIRRATQERLVDYAGTLGENSEDRAAVLTLASSKAQTDLLIDRASDEFEEIRDTGRPILDAIANWFRDFTANPQKWVEFIREIVAIFTGGASLLAVA